MNHDLAETGKLRCQFLPQPRGHVFNGGILQALDLIQVRMIQPVQKRLHRLGNFRVIIDPADLRIDLALDDDLKFERVTVHLGAFVVARKIRQRLGCLETEFFDDACAHELGGRVLKPLQGFLSGAGGVGLVGGLCGGRIVRFNR